MNRYTLLSCVLLCMSLFIMEISAINSRSRYRRESNPYAKDLTREDILRILNRFDNDYDDTTILEDKNKCDSFTKLEDNIIQTRKSLKNGATFLGGVSNASTPEECKQACCAFKDEVGDCDVGVFQANPSIIDQVKCYLFRCYIGSDNTNKCQFSHHADYTIFKRVGLETEAQQLNNIIPDTDKEALRTSTTKTSTEATTSTTTTTTTPTTTTTTTTPTSTTTTTPTTTTPSTTTQGSTTTTMTPTTTTTTTPITTTTTTARSTTTQLPPKDNCNTKCSKMQWSCDNKCCVSVFDVCDGVVQCTDGSDESDCVKIRKNLFADKQTSTTTTSTAKSTTTTTTTLLTNSEILESLVIEDEEKEENEKLQKEIKELKEENVNLVPNQSAVLPLALGLIVTACVLLMVACRVRMMKKKLRRHKGPLAMDEADYLINGMYL